MAADDMLCLGWHTRIFWLGSQGGQGQSLASVSDPREAIVMDIDGDACMSLLLLPKVLTYRHIQSDSSRFWLVDGGGDGDDVDPALGPPSCLFPP